MFSFDKSSCISIRKKDVVVVFVARGNKQNPIQGGGRFDMGRRKGVNQVFFVFFYYPILVLERVLEFFVVVFVFL